MPPPVVGCPSEEFAQTGPLKPSPTFPEGDPMRDQLITLKNVSFLVAILALAIWGVAQNPPATNPPPAVQSPAPVALGPAKIAFVNIQQAIAACDEGKDEMARWSQYADKMSAELQARQKELESLRTQFEIQSSKLSDEARADLADSIDTKDTSFQRLQQDTQKDADKRRQRFQSRIFRKTLPVIAKIAKEKALSSVHFIDETRDGYIDPSLVITDEVVRAYNQAYPVGAVALQPPAKKL